MDASILKKNIIEGSETALVNKDVVSMSDFKPQMILNDYKEGKKVIATLIDELSTCDEFKISVAFITLSGITPLLQVLKELEEKGVKGQIITTDYLTFSEPKALEKLNSLKNITLKMYRTSGSNDGFHTKGYIFKKGDSFRIIVGSSNLTQNAITVNKEWNTRIVSTDKGEFYDSVLNEFHNLWNSDNTYLYNDISLDYSRKYKEETERLIEIRELRKEIIEKQKEIEKENEIPSLVSYNLTPNSMQLGFIRELENLYTSGENKALLISATGTGKTYASAFALRHLKAGRVLFIVHREQIARQALESYKKVFGDKVSMGILSGTSKDTNSRFIFSTRQTLSKNEVLNSFDKSEFDFIVIDEVHNAGAESYFKIMDYFKPQMYLGMTASPERTDGFDIYGLFNHNIAYEIRLSEALEEDMLCPFHYFGITDININDENYKDFSKFNNIESENRFNYIADKIKYFGYSGDRVKGLIFVSTKEEGRKLSEGLNLRGFKTQVITGEDSQEERKNAIEKLTKDSGNDILDYIITVNVFNEGVDIPEINQVVLLRPTESPIVFVQQLGRGLRKNIEKEFVVIIDFIGNYRNNYMIPMALFGDKTYNKDNVRRTLLEGNKIIPGSSTISFDEISRKRIFQAIDTANFSQSKLIVESYVNLKNKLGKIPKLMDFEKYGSIDVQRIFENKSFGSYHNFLVKKENEYNTRFTDTQTNMIEFISQMLTQGKRPHELELLNLLIQYKDDENYNIKDSFINIMDEKYGIKVTERTILNVTNILTNNFSTGSSVSTYNKAIFIEEGQEIITISGIFKQSLENDEFKDQVLELIELGLYRNNRDYFGRYNGTSLKLYSKYTYDDVCRLLEWSKGIVAQIIGGYFIHNETNTFPVFINYHKDDSISETINYEDRFINSKTLVALSKSKRKVDSNDVKTALKAKELGIEMHLFVRKNKDDKNSKEFYYLGPIEATGKVEAITMGEKKVNAVEIEYELEVPVRDDIYHYIIN